MLSSRYSFQNYQYESKYFESNIKLLLNTQFSSVDCILIESGGGMGGTHLLSCFYNWLNLKAFNTVEIDIYKFKMMFYKDKYQLNRLFNNHFLFIDGFHCLYENTESEIIDYFERTAANYFKAGKKMFLKINHKVIEKRFFDYINKFKINEIILERVSPKILIKMAQIFAIDIGGLIDRKMISFLVNLEYESYREFQAFMVIILNSKLLSDDKRLLKAVGWQERILNQYKNFKQI